MNKPEYSLRSDLKHIGCGVCMGAADVVPGVSGGTVALVLGIYERLIFAIGRFDRQLLDYLYHRQWRLAAARIDLRFLLGLLVGIGGGVLVMAMLMGHLLGNATTRPLTFAAFFGMIAASGILVAAMIKVRSATHAVVSLVLGITGAAIAFGLTMLHGHPVEPSYAYLFLCAAIGICAMILPGISGAMILVLLGVYTYMTQAPRDLLHGENVLPAILSGIVFVAGCATGLLCFSKVLKWLLGHYHSATMAVLCGFMFGAMWRLWPFQVDTTPDADFKHKVFEPFLPTALDASVWLVLATGIAAAALVLVVDQVTRRQNAKAEMTSTDTNHAGATPVKTTP